MNIEKQVCTLEQAKTLKDFGIKQKSFFAWVEVDKAFLISKHTDKKELVLYNMLMHENWAAFTVAELFVILDEQYTVHENECHWLAKMLAERLIQKLENKIITTLEVNKRLAECAPAK